MSVGGYGGPGSRDKDAKEQEQFHQLQAAVDTLATNLSGHNFTQQADAPQVIIKDCMLVHWTCIHV